MTTPSEPIEIYCVKCKAKTASKSGGPVRGRRC